MPKYERNVSIDGKTQDEIYEVVAAGIERFMSKTPGGDHSLDYYPEDYLIKIKSSMLSGTLQCHADGITLSGSLALLAMPFKSKLDEGIDKWVAKNFPS